MKVGSAGNLGLSREYSLKLFGPMFYSWWNCPLKTWPPGVLFAMFDKLHRLWLKTWPPGVLFTMLDQVLKDGPGNEM